MSSNKPIKEHIADLRGVVFTAVAVFILGAVITHFYYEQITDFLLAKAPEADLVFLGPLDALFFILKVDAIGGLILTAPILTILVFRFVAPAFSRARKKLVGVYAFSSFILAVLGLSYALLVALPLVLDVLLGIEVPGVSHMLAADQLLSFALLLAFFIVLVSQIPLLVIGLTHTGAVYPQSLADKRGTIYVSATAGLALITPTTDIFTLLILIGPAILLFELSLGISRLINSSK